MMEDPIHLLDNGGGPRWGGVCVAQGEGECSGGTTYVCDKH